jgi:hypothetical protein
MLFLINRIFQVLSSAIFSKVALVFAKFSDKVLYLAFITLSGISCCVIISFNSLILCDFFDFLFLEVSPSSLEVKTSKSYAGSMECSGLLMSGISSSFYGSVSESVYGKFRTFAFFTVDCSGFVLKSSLFLSFLGFTLDFFSSGEFGRALLLFELL